MIGHVLAAANQISGVLAQGRRPGGAGFTGAYDAIPSIVAAYGMRRLLTTYTGPILRLRRSSDSTEQDIGYTAVGHLDTAAVAAFIGAGSGYIRTWYDQSGNAYGAAQTTPANQPLYVASGQNGRPVVRFDGAGDRLVTAAFLSELAQPNTVLVDWDMLSTSGGPFLIDGIASNKRHTINPDTNAGKTIYFSAGENINYSGYLPGYMATSVLYHGTSGQIWQNGVSKATGNIGVQSLSGLSIGARFDGLFGIAANLAELVICNAALSDANRQAAEAAANAYWAIF